MGFLTSLFGGDPATFFTTLLVIALILILIGLVLWGGRLVMAGSDTVTRSRSKRLAVIDSIPVDAKRKLVILRRDDTEHLVMIGGDTELVIETGFEAVDMPEPRRVPAQAARRGRREPLAPNGKGLGDPGPPANERRAPLLRNTGLLRPVSRMEPTYPSATAENGGDVPPAHDSTAETAHDETGQSRPQD